MPTTLPRYMVTDTGPIAQALDTAQLVWPEVPRGSAAITKLVTVASELLNRDAQTRVRAVDGLTQFGDVYTDGYLARLREEWPA